MSLTPIALGVKNLQLESPLAQAAQAANIQAVRDSNAMRQYNMAQAQDQNRVKNVLSEAFKKYNPQTGDVSGVIDFLQKNNAAGSVPDVVELGQKIKTKDISNKDNYQELLTKKYINARRGLEGLNPTDPQAPELYFKWHMTNHSDPDIMAELKPRIATIAQQKGMTFEEYYPLFMEEQKQRITQASQSPELFAKMINESKAGIEKFMQMSASKIIKQSDGQTERLTSVPVTGGEATIVPGSQVDILPTKYQEQQLALRQAALDSKNQAATAKANPVNTQVDEGTLGKERAKLLAKAEAALPTVKKTGVEVKEYLREMIGDARINEKTGEVEIPKGGKPYHPGFQQAIGVGIPFLSKVPGTDTKDFALRHDQIKSGSFLQAYISALKGSGQITNIEGQKGTEAINRMNTASSEAEYIRAAQDMIKWIDRNEALVEEAVKQKQQPSAGSAAPLPTQAAPIRQPGGAKNQTSPVPYPADIMDLLNKY